MAFCALVSVVGTSCATGALYNWRNAAQDRPRPPVDCDNSELQLFRLDEDRDVLCLTSATEKENYLDQSLWPFEMTILDADRAREIHSVLESADGAVHVTISYRRRNLAKTEVRDVALLRSGNGPEFRLSWEEPGADEMEIVESSSPYYVAGGLHAKLEKLEFIDEVPRWRAATTVALTPIAVVVDIGTFPLQCWMWPILPFVYPNLGLDPM